ITGAISSPDHIVADPVTITCAEPDVTIDIIGEPDTIFQGQRPGFTITVTNTSDEDVSGVALESQLPDEDGTHIWPPAPDGREKNENQLLTCDDLEIPANSSIEIKMRAVSDYTLHCDVQLEASARLTEGGNGEASAYIDVECLDLAIGIAPDASEVDAGNDIGA